MGGELGLDEADGDSESGDKVRGLVWGVRRIQTQRGERRRALRLALSPASDPSRVCDKARTCVRTPARLRPGVSQQLLARVPRGRDLRGEGRGRPVNSVAFYASAPPADNFHKCQESVAPRRAGEILFLDRVRSAPWPGSMRRRGIWEEFKGLHVGQPGFQTWLLSNLDAACQQGEFP